MQKAIPARPQPATPTLYRARLSEVIGSFLDVQCSCGHHTAIKIGRPQKDRQLGEIASVLKCTRCRRTPKTIHLGETYPPFSDMNTKLASYQLFPPVLH